MSGPHPSTQSLISQIIQALKDKGTMTFDELAKQLKVTGPRLRSALNWALRTDVKCVGDRRYRVSK